MPAQRSVPDRLVPGLIMVEHVAQVEAIDRLTARRTVHEVHRLRQVRRDHWKGVELFPAGRRCEALHREESRAGRTRSDRYARTTGTSEIRVVYAGDFAAARIRHSGEPESEAAGLTTRFIASE